MLDQAAVRQWALVLGAENVITAEDQLSAAGTATFPVYQRVPAILRPATREEVRQILRIATHFRIPLYPVSSGKNWGYGSGVPAVDGCVVLDLSRMSRILDFSEELGYVTVEPGVTQGQLFEFLRTRNSRLWIDGTGSSPDCSLVGNALERGFGHTPYGEHIANVCDFEVMLPSGDTLETGVARFPGALAAPVYRWGLGPSLDGLFAQSNFGVVTRVTLWLMPAPEYFQAFFFRCDSEAAILAVVDALRPAPPERHSAQRHSYRKRLQGSVRNSTIPVEGNRRRDSPDSGTDAELAPTDEFRRLEWIRGTLRIARTGG